MDIHKCRAVEVLHQFQNDQPTHLKAQNKKLVDLRIRNLIISIIKLPITYFKPTLTPTRNNNHDFAPNTFFGKMSNDFL